MTHVTFITPINKAYAKKATAKQNVTRQLKKEGYDVVDFTFSYGESNGGYSCAATSLFKERGTDTSPVEQHEGEQHGEEPQADEVHIADEETPAKPKKAKKEKKPTMEEFNGFIISSKSTKRATSNATREFATPSDIDSPVRTAHKVYALNWGNGLARKEMVALAVAEGVGLNTARSQYQIFKKRNGL